MSKILVIPDTQCKPNISLDYCTWIGEYIVDKQPDVIVHLGDHFDMPSLSSYDRGKLAAEGRRIKEDVDAGIEGMSKLLYPLKLLQAKQKKGKQKVYSPRMVFCLGNHEQRLSRISKDMPEFAGLIGYDQYKLQEEGWEVHDFLKPVEIEGIHFVHYLANEFTVKPYGGSALSILKNRGDSFVMGHKQTLDIAVRPTLSGRMQLGIIAGACYEHDEEYKGYQGNSHYRGLIMLHGAKDGYADVCMVNLNYLKKKYGGST